MPVAPVKTIEDAVKAVEDADAVLDFNSPELVKAGKKLRWIGLGYTGMEKDLSPELVGSQIVLTNTKRLYAPLAVREHTQGPTPRPPRRSGMVLCPVPRPDPTLRSVSRPALESPFRPE